MNRFLLPILLIAAGCSASSFDLDSDSTDALNLPIPDGADFAQDRVLVGLMGDDLPGRIHAARLGLELVRPLSMAKSAIYAVPPGENVRDTVDALRATGEFRYVEPDYERHVSADDPYLPYQWNLAAIGAESAWALSTGAGAVVAVIDTGVTSGPNDGIHALTAGYDFVNNDWDPADDYGHGTHVAGTIAAATNNGAGVAGVAYNANIMAIKVLDASGSGYASDTVDGIYYAINNGADVINMSLGSSYGSTTEAQAVLDAYNAGVFVAAAAGNSGRRTVEYPAAYTGAVAVGATRYDNTRARYSCYGSALDLMAPGGDTAVDQNGDGYADGILQETFEYGSWGFYFWQGTSMATPHVAGAAALLMSLGATGAEAEAYLEGEALDLGSGGWDKTYGWGLIQPGAALAAYINDNVPTDMDGDGWTLTGGDCDDSDPSVYPGASDTWYDGIDSNCDGASDYDADLDGFDSADFGGTDCQDDDDAINPGAEDICEDGIDQDCDGSDATCTPACAVYIGVAEYTSRKSQLKVTATGTDLSASLDLYADGAWVGVMNLKASSWEYKASYTPIPADVEVVADCGGTDSASVTIK